MSAKTITAIAALLIAAGAAVWLLQPWFAQAPTTSEPLPSSDSTPTASPITPPSRTTMTTKLVNAQDIDGATNAYTFTATVPATWQAESIAGSAAISFYDPTTTGDTTIEQSQIFIRSFEANDFLTLSTVTIHHQEALTINNRPAVRYDIEKNQGVANFPAQPTWRNERHIVTDIRVSDSNPSIFYVIAKRPSLSDTTYQEFLQNLQVTPTNTTNLQAPINQFRERITKKPFGIFITPQTSPVQPERFSGYHTGVDVEYEEITSAVPVRAITAGTVLTARVAQGYGGVVAIQHEIDNQPVIGIYGHLDPATIPNIGTNVTAGQQVGLLGQDKSAETDGERKHLHFALLKGSTPTLAGYVQNEAELDTWLDPLTILP